MAAVFTAISCIWLVGVWRMSRMLSIGGRSSGLPPGRLDRGFHGGRRGRRGRGPLLGAGRRRLAGDRHELGGLRRVYAAGLAFAGWVATEEFVGDLADLRGVRRRRYRRGGDAARPRRRRPPTLSTHTGRSGGALAQRLRTPPPTLQRDREQRRDIEQAHDRRELEAGEGLRRRGQCSSRPGRVACGEQSLPFGEGQFGLAPAIRRFRLPPDVVADLSGRHETGRTAICARSIRLGTATGWRRGGGGGRGWRVIGSDRVRPASATSRIFAGPQFSIELAYGEDGLAPCHRRRGDHDA